MLINRLTYFAYLISSGKPFNWKTKSLHALLLDETLPTLKSRLKFNSAFEVKTDKKLDTTHLETGGSLSEILNQYKKPSLIQLTKTAGIRHHRVLYKRKIYGVNSIVVYHFINQQIASVTLQIHVEGAKHLASVNQHIADDYLNGRFPSNHTQFTITDAKGNKLMYERADQVRLIYINNNPEINQNINAALYHDRYSNEKYIDSARFQLSL